MNEILNIYAQVLNLKWQLNAKIIQEGVKVIDMINEAKRFERQYQDDKKRNEFKYQQIMQMRKNLFYCTYNRMCKSDIFQAKT